MKGRDALFQLIRAMTPSEKRYFTLDAQKSGKKGARYLALFHRINAMEAYDESALKAAYPKSLSFDKGYLYDAILRSMRDFHSSKSLSATIKEHLLDARYLFERSLYRQCEVRLQEAQRFAEKLGDHLLMLEVNKEFRRLTLATKGMRFENRLEQLALEGKQQLKATVEEMEYLQLYERLSSLVLRQFEIREADAKAAFIQGFPVEKLKPENEPSSDLAKLKFFQCNALFHQLLGDFEHVMEYFSKVVAWWESHPAYRGEEYYRYIVDFSNLLHAYISNGQGHLLPLLLEQLENARPDSETARRILFQRVTIYRLIAYINYGIPKEPELLQQEIGEGLDKFNIPMSTRSTIIFNMGVLLFIHGRLSECLQWCDRIIGDRKSKYRQDVRAYLYLLRLMAAYQLADARLLEGAYRSAYRHLKRAGRLTEGDFEAAILEYIRLLMSTTPKASANIWTDLKAYLEKVHRDPAVKVAHGFDELLLLWANSRMKRKPMPELVRP